MKDLTRILSLLTFSLVICSFAVGQETESRNLNAFEGISISGGIKAELVQGNTNKIDITAKGIDIEKVATEIRRDVLKVGIDEKWWKNLGMKKKRDVSVVITYSAPLSSISASSGSTATANHTILSKYLELDVSSGATIDLDIDVNESSINLSSGAAMNLKGNAQEMEIDMSSGAVLNAYDLVGQNVEIDGSSGSVAKIHASQTLNADVSSGASVKYKGEPNKKDIDKSSGGSVNKSSSM